jgi:hypothetical protein
MSNQLITINQPENWIHYSPTASQILLSSRAQNHTDIQSLYFKPKGLWITPEYADMNWFEWCEGEKFHMENLNYIHDVKIKSDANLLRLESPEDIDNFTDEYGLDILTAVGVRQRHPIPEFAKRRKDGIQWNVVADKYQGILIPAYHWSRRLDFNTAWYYAWDCASGCIWDADAVESVTVRSEVSAGYEADPEQTPEAISRRLREASAQIKKLQEEREENV